MKERSGEKGDDGREMEILKQVLYRIMHEEKMKEWGGGGGREVKESLMREKREKETRKKTE